MYAGGRKRIMSFNNEKWICPHCTAENDATDERCIYCGCKKEIKIPEAPVTEILDQTEVEQAAREVPQQETPQTDYSSLAPNNAPAPKKKNNVMLGVLLAVACVAVMGIGLLFATRAKDPETVTPEPAAEPAEGDPEIYELDPEDYDTLLDGEIGDTLSTAFFDFKVNSAKLEDSYEGLTPAEGKKFAVVDIWVKNTMRESIPMFDTDFVLIYGDGENDYAFPVTTDAPEKQTGKMLASEYTLGINEETQGILVYEVPEDIEEAFVYFEEYFDNGEYGEYYTVYTKF